MAIALTCKIGASGSRWLRGTMVTVFYAFCVCVVCCCVCKRRLVLGCLPLAHNYNILYCGILLGVGISIVVLDTYANLVKYLAWDVRISLTAGCKAFSLANGKGMGTNDWVIKSLDD
jgi:hypothetical protein